MNRLGRFACALAASLPLILHAQTQSMRCSNDLANLGDNKASVLQKCGTPVAKDSFCKPVDRSSVTSEQDRAVVLPCETVDEWTYNPGRGQFMTTLRFESGKLTAITYGDRVK
ncbi:DUF2845 domain-containing protein [Sphaerotilaceae bacterium SBD11-9]